MYRSEAAHEVQHGHAKRDGRDDDGGRVARHIGCRCQRGGSSGNETPVAQDSPDTVIHPEDVHRQRAREHDGRGPRPARGRERTEGEGYADVDVEDDTGRKEHSGEELEGRSERAEGEGRGNRAYVVVPELGVQITCREQERGELENTTKSEDGRVVVGYDDKP